MSAMARLGKPTPWTFYPLTRKFCFSLIPFTKASLLSTLKTDLQVCLAILRTEVKKPRHGFYKRLVDTTGFR